MTRDSETPKMQSDLGVSRLERELGVPAAQWTLDHTIDVVEKDNIRLISLMHMGGDGWLKALDFVPRSVGHLRDIFIGGERADGSSLFRNVPTGASDVVLRPKIETAFIDPFAPEPTLAVLCRHVGADGQPLPQSPDTIVQRAYERARVETGVDLWALGEIEYFIGRLWTHSDRYGKDDHGYHSTTPVAFSQPLRRRAMTLLGEIGIPIKYGHAEVGYVRAMAPGEVVWEQHEVELALTPLPRAAECVALTQWVLHNLALEMGMDCSFDPIIGEGHAGNGLHFHFSPMVDGVHTASGQTVAHMQEPAKWLIGGLATIGGALMALGNRDPRSFVRITQAKEAPSSVFWGARDRRALIRLPVTVTAPDGRVLSPPTIEFRLPDGSAHSHLLLAGVAQALSYGSSLQNIDELLANTAAKNVTGLHSHGSRVPTSMPEVGQALRTHRAVLEAGGVFLPAAIDEMITHLESDAL